MRITLLIATSGLAAGAAHAQASDWDGAYGGVSAGVKGLTGTGVTIDIEPGRWPGGDYTGTTYETQSFDSEISSESKLAGTMFGGVLVDAGGWVWGAEAALTLTPLERTYSVGPVDAVQTSSGFPFVPTPPQYNFPPGSQIPQRSEQSTFTSTLEIEADIAARARIGLAFGNELLLSIYGGPSVASATLQTLQQSDQHAFVFAPNPGGGSSIFIQGENTSTYAASTSETLVGVNAGALAEYRITEDWIARADVSYTSYGEISVTNAVGSSASIEPDTWSASIGLAFRL